LKATNGKEYLDFTSGIAVTSTGHCHPKIVEAVRAQAEKVAHVQYAVALHEPLLNLTDALGTVLPKSLDSIYYGNSGAEAVEAAIRLARMATGRPNIISFMGGYHGRTVASASLTSARATVRSGFSPLMAGAYVAAFPHAARWNMSEDEAVRFALAELDLLFKAISDPRDTAAFIIEPVLGDGGYIPTPVEFIKGLKKRADEHGILLIFDEIQCGVGRTGKYWAQYHYDVTPDILIFAKGIASGYPISGIAAPESLMRKAWPGSQGGTYCGNAVAAAAAIATIEVIANESLVENAALRGSELRSSLDQLVKDHRNMSCNVRGLGLMQGIEFFDADRKANWKLAEEIRAEAENQGLLLLTCGQEGNVIRIVPPLIVSKKELEQGMDIFSSAIQAVLG